MKPRVTPAMTRPTTPRPGRRTRLRRRIVITVTGLLVLTLTAAAGALWLLTGKLLHPTDDTPLNTRIVAVGTASVTLPATDESRYTGTYGLIWQDSGSTQRHSGVLGRILDSDSRTVTRELRTTTPPAVGDKAKIAVTVWSSDPRQALGLDYQDVSYPGDLGPMPAWFLPGSRSTWVIQVHGLGAGRSAGLRAMPELHDLGYPVLDITYRNDPGAPHDSNGNRQLGNTEWRDLDAAVRYAQAHGASGVVLYGFSMGGGIVETYLQRASETSAVRSVILDSPALDYRAAIDTIGTGLGLPFPVADVAAPFIRLRAGVDLDQVDTLAANRRDGGPEQPVLLFHGTADTLVPYASSARFARDWPDEVKLVTVPGAGHTGSWNADPARYDSELADFLDQHG
ncbi:alpha/beta hydrolase [Kitasatospora sp. NBC_01287]|uniref:alpha/beta hydrolase n=1 Tax=Kitasatospora sp. NBC_01287 TaxID=2903573 RepID=UPI00224DC22E|nr:alpha/beta fold hydrolase [Kitasatospora sp. NBC_01287]MCX4744180.1 alpha/beta hydrolase [Kitasatospora sp. NBC_01287]